MLFLEPIIRRLKSAGWHVRITAKPQAQTLELAKARGLEVEQVGAGDLVGRATKVLGGVARAAQLAWWIGPTRRPRLLICSSRTAALAAYVLRIPVVGLLDYEHAEHRPLALASRSLWLPDLLRDVPLSGAASRVARYYAGLKENLYLDSWPFDRAAERRALGITEGEWLVVARPPATTAHYASGEGYALWMAAVSGLGGNGARILVTPRDQEQRAWLRVALQHVESVTVLDRLIPGPGLVAAADLVLGGGGTMNREAAVLGIPVWSLFTGPTPHIDDRLAAEGRLRWVRSGTEVSAALADPRPTRRPGRGPFPAGLASILSDILQHLGVPPEALI